LTVARNLEQQISRLTYGDHICLIYENTAQQLAAAVPFIKQGLAKGDRCVYVAHDRTVKEISEALTAEGVDVAKAAEQGALGFYADQDTYLQSGEFTPETMIDLVRQWEAKALADGFSGLRFTGEPTWAGPEKGNNRLIEYEALLNGLVTKSRTIILCQYNHDRFDAPCIHDVFRTHPLAILSDQVCSNAFYESPEMVLHSDQITASGELKARRVDWWISQLTGAKIVEHERDQVLERLHNLSRRLLEVQESERRHQARELHDEVGQKLTGLRLLLNPNSLLPGNRADQHFQEALTVVDDLLERVRAISFDLRPAALDQLGLLAALLALFERYTQQTGVQVRFSHNSIDRRFSPELETAAYRIVQESLTNVARHSGITDATVRVWATAEALGVQIEDSGGGFDAEAATKTPRSSGLAGMQERAVLLGGHLTIDSQPGAGTQVTAEFPLPNDPKGEPPCPYR
jgi:signal transduction histidine kinase